MRTGQIEFLYLSGFFYRIYFKISVAHFEAFWKESEWNDIRLWSVFCTNYFYLFTTARLPLFVMAFHKEKLLSYMCIYIKKLAKIILWSNSDIFGTKLQVWIWTSTSLPGMRLGCSSTCSTSICWNEIRFGLTAELFYWGLKIDRHLDKKTADIKWVASELVEVVCYTSVSLTGIHGTRRNILSFSFVVLCFLVVQWNVICWIWKISIMIKFSDDHVFSFFFFSPFSPVNDLPVWLLLLHPLSVFVF